ncbi:MAG: diguanylate cyclase [Candidatus Competibacteraceae bacterium]|nr:diguanylate cyclase [Candidatus Competibacteraceae bacterium]
MNIINAVLSPAPLYSGQRQRFLIVGGVYFVLWIAAWYAADRLNHWGGVSLWYLPAGLRFCCLLVFGWRGLLLEWVAELIALLFTTPGMDSISVFLSAPPYWLLYHWMVMPLSYAAVILPLRRWMRNPWDFTNPGHRALFLVAALAVSALAALAGTFGAVYSGLIPLTQGPEALLSWIIGDFTGIIALVPLLLVRVWPGLHHYLQQGCWRRLPLSTAVSSSSDLSTMLIVALALLLVFGIPWRLDLNPHFPLTALLLLLPLAWITLHYSLRGAVLAVVMLDSGLVVLIVLFGQRDAALPYQLVMIAIALVGLWLGGVVEARNRLMVRYRDFASASNDLLWETDVEGRLLEASGRLARHVVLIPGQSWRLLLNDGLQPHLAALEHALSQQQPFHHLEIALQGAGETPRWIQLNGLPLLDELGELIGYRGTAVDVSRSRRAEALLRNYNEELLHEVSERTRALRQTNGELAAKERHLQVLLAAAPVGVLELDDAQCCRYLNANGCALTGCTPEQAQGRHILDFVHPDDRDYVDFIWQINRQSDEVQWLEFRLNRTSLWCAAHWINLAHSDESMDGAIMVLTNATARRQQDERLWTLAHHDTLTEVPNRSLFWDRLGQALRRAKRRESGTAVLWIDLDGFKAVNDSLGHAAGDALLQQVARRLKIRMRDSDTVARMGGDEFAVILPDITESEGAVRVATELTASLAEPFELPQGPAHISGSIGVALYPQHAETAETLTQYADMAMYTAKHAGKNQVQVWYGR